MIDELQDIKSIHSGNSFKKIDLHIHSPASNDHGWGDINEFEFLGHFEDKGFDIIAVTDHNSGKWIDKLMRAAKDQRDRNGWNIHVLPGVEISATGIHLTIIFPENTNSDKIGHFLSQIKIEPSDWGNPEVITEKSPSEVCEIAHHEDFNGIVIGAHCNSSKNSVVGAMSGIPREETLEKIDILELKVNSSAEKTIEYVRRDLGFPEMPFIFSSDSHKPDDIVSETCWLKMDICSFSGVQQIIFEPHLRCTYSPPKEPSYPHIIGISIIGGLYSGEQISLNPNLNVMIGGRGAGKSALIDLIRFAFGIEPKIKEDERISIDRVTNFLNIGDKVRVFLHNKGKEYILERTMNYLEEGPKSKLVRVLDSKPIIYEVTSIEPLRIEKSTFELFPIEIFAQGEVFALTKRVDEQRKLIDEYIGTEPYLQEEKNIISLLNKNAETIIKSQALLDEQINRSSNREDIEKRIGELQKHTQDEIFVEHDKWEEENRYYSLSKQKEEEVSKLTESFTYEIDSLPKLPDKTPNSSEIENYNQIYNTLKSSIKFEEGKIHKSISEYVVKLQEIRSTWKNKYDKEDELLAEKLKELGVSDRAVIFGELQDKKTALKIIEEEIIPEIKRLNDIIENCKIERGKIVKQLYDSRKKLTDKRLELINKFNNELKNTVNITLETEADPDIFIEKLNDIYDRSGIKNRDKIWVALIDNKVDPMKLADIILSKDNATLESFGITSDAASKIIQYPTLEQVFDIQTIKMEDIPNISLKKEGEYDFTPLKELSFGEKCSAILSIVMLNKEYPLIIDQPEDELDHAFINENVVTTVRKIKHRRQLLISIHNPNIPVLGDAELVIKVKKLPRKITCTVERARGLEDKEIIKHLKVLEGGEDALQKRSQKYGLKVKT